MRTFSARRRHLLGLVAGTCLLQACGGGAAGPLRVATHVWPGYELMFLARQLGWLAAEQVAFVETATATASRAALLAGQADAAALTLDEVLRARADGLPLMIVLVFDISSGADAVLARSELRVPADLAGRRVGVETSALGALMLHKLLESASLGVADVEVVPIAADDHYAAWQQGRLDAIITYEPAAGRIEAAGWQRLYDSRALPDTIFDVLAVRPDAAQTHAASLRGLAAAHFRALRHLQTHAQDAAYRMAGRLGVAPDKTYDVFRGLHLPGLDVNRRLLSRQGPLLSAAVSLSSIMVRAGLLPRDDDMSNLLSTDWLPKDKA